AKANLLQQSFISTITLKGHSANNYAAATTITTLSSFTSATLVGPQSEDYLTTFATSSSYAYWFVNYNATSASKVPHAKLFLGTYSDRGMDLNAPPVITRERPTGARRKALYTFDLTWKGMTYAKTVSLYQRFYKPRRHSPVVLFTSSYHDALLGHQAV